MKAMPLSARPHCDLSLHHPSSRTSGHQGFLSVITKQVYFTSLKKFVFAGVFKKTTRASSFPDTERFSDVCIPLCFFTHLFCLNLSRYRFYRLFWWYQPSSVLAPSLLFSYSLSFLLFISSVFHSAGDKRFRSR